MLSVIRTDSAVFDGYIPVEGNMGVSCMVLDTMDLSLDCHTLGSLPKGDIYNTQMLGSDRGVRGVGLSQVWLFGCYVVVKYGNKFEVYYRGSDHVAQVYADDIGHIRLVSDVLAVAVPGRGEIYKFYGACLLNSDGSTGRGLEGAFQRGLGDANKIRVEFLLSKLPSESILVTAGLVMVKRGMQYYLGGIWEGISVIRWMYCCTHMLEGTFVFGSKIGGNSSQ